MSIKIPNITSSQCFGKVDYRTNILLRENISKELHSFATENGIYTHTHPEVKIKDFNSGTKRIMDAIVAVTLLTILAPLIGIIAFAIKIESKGPVLFIQHRTGIMGRRFKMYKFRTMVNDAEEIKSKLSHLNSHEAGSPDFKVKNDPRVTRLGRFLRKSSIDEIPQLINVVTGDMRLVGPRPTSFSADTYEPNHLTRLLVFPGLTGLWQISGRSNITFDDRVKLDCQYILKQNTMLDLKILLRTPVAVLKGNGAY